jgi:hypothetical protein
MRHFPVTPVEPTLLCVVRIERERDGEAWLVLRGDHAWLHGDRRQALRDRDRLDRAERFPWWRP